MTGRLSLIRTFSGWKFSRTVLISGESGHKDGGRPLPLLVIVSGAPASGKTTLARHLSQRLGLPLLDKDSLKEILAEELGEVRSVADSRTLGLAVFRTLYAVSHRILDAGVGLVLEANFFRGVAEPELAPLVSRTRAVLIHCSVQEEVSRRRYVERFQQGHRHWSHFDGERIARFGSGEFDDSWLRAQPLKLEVPTLVVNTTRGYDPDLDVIATYIKQS